MHGGETRGILENYGGPRPTSVTGSILGGSLMDRIRAGTNSNGRDKTEVDVEFLLKGAENLCAV